MTATVPYTKAPLLMPEDGKGLPAEKRPRVMAYVHSVMEKAKAWAPTFDEITNGTTRADGLMRDMGLDTDDWTGARFKHRTAGPFKKTYGFAVLGAELTYQWAEGGWRLIDCRRLARAAGEPAEIEIDPTAEQRANSREGWVAGAVVKIGFKRK